MLLKELLAIWVLVKRDSLAMGDLVKVMTSRGFTEGFTLSWDKVSYLERQSVDLYAIIATGSK